MTPIPPVTLGLLIQEAYDLTADAPPPDLSALGLKFVAPIYGVDIIAGRVPYGIIAADPAGQVIVAIRGTDSAPEWIEDFAFLLEPCPFLPGAKTERGFTGVYLGLKAGGLSLVEYVRRLQADVVVATGHSLGAALAALFAVDYGASGLVEFAGPMVGDAAFAAAAQARIAAVGPLYADPMDVVPYSPPAVLGYTRTGPATEVSPGLKIVPNPICYHSLSTYLHCIDPSQPLESSCCL